MVRGQGPFLHQGMLRLVSYIESSLYIRPLYFWTLPLAIDAAVRQRCKMDVLPSGLSRFSRRLDKPHKKTFVLMEILSQDDEDDESE